MKNQPPIKELYTKLLKKEISEQELLQLNTYFNTGDPNELYHLIRLELDFSDEVEESTPKEQAVLKRVHNHISTEKFRHAVATKQQETTKLWLRIAVAAAMTAIIFGAGLFYYSVQNKTDQNFNASNDIAPGINSATLTLADGRKIRLSDAVKGELAKEAGVRITKTKDGQVVYTLVAEPGEIASQARNDGTNSLNTLSTAKGEMYQIVLPDKSVVWLNAASSLKYPASFANLKERKVVLDGEAYFQVKHDAKQPFRVQTTNQLIEDIGTVFNVNSYTDEPGTKTTLVEGSVKIASQARNDADGAGSSSLRSSSLSSLRSSSPSSLRGGTPKQSTPQDIILHPGEQAVSLGTDIRITKVDPETATGWKNGDFIFEGADFKSAMRKIARWYNVEIVYDPSIGNDIELGGWTSRKNNLSVVLKWIESTNNVHFKVKGRRITVTK